MNYLNLAQTITNLQEISYDFIQTMSKWPLFTSDKHTYITLYTSHYILKTVRVAQLNLTKDVHCTIVHVQRFKSKFNSIC